jgi:hypothetical protein
MSPRVQVPLLGGAKPGPGFTKGGVMKSNWALAGYALMAVLIVAVIFYAIREQNKWETWCHDKGGNVSHHTDWITVPDGNGGTTSTSNTTYYCITDDGRLLGVR